jgi:hypothetical protein
MQNTWNLKKKNNMKKTTVIFSFIIVLFAIITSCNTANKSSKSETNSPKVNPKTVIKEFVFEKEATIYGTLQEVEFSEPSETQMKTYVLVLDKTINVISKSKKYESQNFVEEIQIDFSEQVTDPSVYLNKKITVKGTLLPSKTLHDKRPVVMNEGIIVVDI